MVQKVSQGLLFQDQRVTEDISSIVFAQVRKYHVPGPDTFAREGGLFKHPQGCRILRVA